MITSTLSWACACGTASNMLNRSEEPMIIFLMYAGLFVMDKSVLFVSLKSEAALQSNGAVGRIACLGIDDGRLYLHAEIGGYVEIG